MFDKIVEALHSELLKSWPGDRMYRPADFNAGGLPEPVAAILLAQLERLALEEMGILDADKLNWVDKESPQVAEAFERLRETARDHVAIPADRWSELLRSTIGKLVAAHLDPRGELARLIYEPDEQELETSDAIERLQRRFGHPSLSEALVDSLLKKSLDLITRERFSTIVGKVDELRTESFALADWILELEPIAEIAGTTGLPTPALATYLSDKGFSQAADSIERIDPDHVTLEDLRDLATEAADVASPQPVEDTTDEVVQAVASFEASTETLPTPVGDGPVPLWRRFQKNLNEPIAGSSRPITPGTKPRPPIRPSNGPSSPLAVASTDKPEEPEEKIQQPLWKKFRSGTDATGTTSSPKDEKADGSKKVGATVSSSIDRAKVIKEIEARVLGKEGLNTRDTFIDVLFRGAEDDYLSVIEELHSAGSWGEASQVIAERVFKRNQVNIYSEAAVAFTNAVESRFRSAKVPG